jgi:hypothetical protein
MKKSILISILAISLTGGLWAQGMPMEPRSVDVIVADIEKQQNVSSPDLVNVDKVPPALLEELGDAVMGLIIGDPAHHDVMDKMLGGDGSPRLTAFHTDLGQQYLRNGGLNGVRMGGSWGMGRFGMMYGWGNYGDRISGKASSIEGKLAFADGGPIVQTKDASYVLGFPDFYFYAYNDGIKAGAALKLDGYLFTSGTGTAKAYFAVTKAVINGKTYDFSGFGPGGMMGGRGMMGGYGGGMMGGWGARW